MPPPPTYDTAKWWQEQALQVLHSINCALERSFPNAVEEVKWWKGSAVALSVQLKGIVEDKERKSRHAAAATTTTQDEAIVQAWKDKATALYAALEAALEDATVPGKTTKKWWRDHAILLKHAIAAECAAAANRLKEEVAISLHHMQNLARQTHLIMRACWYFVFGAAVMVLAALGAAATTYLVCRQK